MSWHTWKDHFAPACGTKLVHQPVCQWGICRESSELNNKIDIRSSDKTLPCGCTINRWYRGQMQLSLLCKSTIRSLLGKKPSHSWCNMQRFKIYLIGQNPMITCLHDTRAHSLEHGQNKPVSVYITGRSSLSSWPMWAEKCFSFNLH